MLINGVFKRAPPVRNALTVDDLIAAGVPITGLDASGVSSAMKLSAVSACMDLITNSIGKLPAYFLDTATRTRIQHPLKRLLCVRPNEAMTPLVARKMVEGDRLGSGNGYLWIIRDQRTLRPAELIPIPASLVQPWRDQRGRMWYDISHPLTGEAKTLPGDDVIHVKGYSANGIKGVSVLERASEVIAAGRAAQQYNQAFYANGAAPGGVLTVNTDLSSRKVPVKDADGIVTEVPAKEIVRAEWEKTHGGPDNAHRTAILDFGLTYQPISISNRDAQFVEHEDLAVQDIARFFGVPLYKLQAGKQSYSSNEQNAIEYVVSTLHPIVTQYEEESTYKLLTDSEINRGTEIRINMMAELRGDTASRGAWYKNMRETGAFSVNDILALEDQPDVEGGDERYASVNYVPLSLFRDLSIKRNSGNNTKGGNNE